MSGPGTLRVATSLRDAGFDAWTPVETLVRRLPRSKKTTEREMPVMPTYVFAPADHIRDLHAFTAMPNSPHPPFSIFRYANSFPLIAGRSLEPLREAEERQREAARRRRRKGEPVPHFEQGTPVKVDDGNFSGMRGVVTKQKGRLCIVAFPDSLMTWEIDALQLVSDMVITGQP
ncbi:hypothetical protein [Sphingobium aromaticiconvertens]|uniref:hypothetical protein n=1 Tax=Sphingobium aromaticiconvertens TaxID=365341 RepID=UPI0030188C06